MKPEVMNWILERDYSIDFINFASKLGYVPNDLRVEDLETIEELMQDFFELSDLDKTNLVKALKDSKLVKRVIEKYSPFLQQFGEEGNKFLAERLLDEAGGDILGVTKVRPSISTIETVLNLGYCDIEFGPSGEKEEPLIPSELLRYNPKILENIIEKDFINYFQGETSYDIEEVRENLKLTNELVRRNFLSQIGFKDAHKFNSKIEKSLEETLSRMNDVVDFYEKYKSEDMNWMWHQAIRTFYLTNQIKRGAVTDVTAAGKTFTLMSTFALLNEKYSKQGKPSKGLIIAPNQAIHSVWGYKKDGEFDVNKYVKSLGLDPLNILVINNRKDCEKISDPNVDLVMINYAKLSLQDYDYSGEDFEERDSNYYIRNLLEHFDNFSFVGVDEAHKLKNIRSNSSVNFKSLVDRSRDKHFILSTATVIPNRLKDIGFFLYMLNPEKYSLYSDQTFELQYDIYSLFNEKNSTKWFDLSQEDLQQIFKLGPLPSVADGVKEKSLDSKLVKELEEANIEIPDDQYPFIYDMAEDFVKRYYEEWSDLGTCLNKVPKLNRILLESSIKPIADLVEEIKSKDSNAQITIFSHLKNGFVDEMIDEIKSRGYSDVGVINGDTSVEKRAELATKYQNNEIQNLIGSTAISESFSLTSGKANNYCIVAQPPFVPGDYVQMIGRFYRNTQEGLVKVYHMIPHSDKLSEMQEKFVKEMSEGGVNVRKTWKPRNIYEDAFLKRIQRIHLQKRAGKIANMDEVIRLSEIGDSYSEENLPSLIPSKDLEKKTAIDELRGGYKAVRCVQGKPIDEVVESIRFGKLIEGYSNRELLSTNTVVRNTGLMIEEIISSIENSGYKINSILDIGSGTSILARICKDRPVVSSDASEYMLLKGQELMKQEKGNPGKYYDALSSDFSLDNLVHDIEEGENIHLRARAQKMPLPDESIDFVSSSYALMYNQQGFGRRDVERIILETNRVLKMNSYGVFVLPNKSKSENLEKFSEMLSNYGFNVLDVKNVNSSSSDNTTGLCYYLFFQKVENYDKGLGKWDDCPPLILYKDRKVVGGDKSVMISLGKKEKQKQNNEESLIDEEFCARTYEIKANGRIRYTSDETLRDNIQNLIGGKQ